MNLDEFIMCTNIVKKPEHKSSSTRRTITNRYYELLPPHPLSETHAIHLTTTHYVPVLAGKPPPLFTAKSSRQEQLTFNWYYCTLLMPWRWHETSCSGSSSCSLPTWGQFRRLLQEDSKQAPPESRCVDVCVAEPCIEQEGVKENTNIAKPVTPEFLQLLAQGRLLRFLNITTSLVADKQVTNLIQAWRGRNRTLWKDAGGTSDLAKGTDATSGRFANLDPELQQTITELLESSTRKSDVDAVQRAADMQRYSGKYLNVLSDLQMQQKDVVIRRYKKN